jgi:hypothetical protein
MTESALILPQPQSTPPAERRVPAERPVNVGDLERWLSLLGGGALAFCIVRRFFGPLVLLGGAGALLSRGLTGHCALYQRMGVRTVSQAPEAPPARSATGPEEQPRIEMARS